MPVKPPGGDAARLHQAAEQLETLFLKQVVSATKAFTGGEGAGSAVRADLFSEALAGALMKGGGIGLARQIERSLGGAPAPAPAAAPPTAAAPAPPAGDDEGDEPQAPVDPITSHRVTSPFGPRHDPFDGRLTRHAGVDLAAADGDPIRAVAAGVVVRAGARGGYGEAVEIDHGDGTTTLYGHASELLVREGDAVTPGQTIARVGHTGRATGSHLHFELRQGGRPIDPARALKNYRLRADDLLGSGS